MTKISFIFVLAFLPLAALAECPLGAKETHLTVNRVMRNFGKFVMEADYLCVRAANPVEKVTDADINTAITKLGMAIDCADQVLKDPTGDVLPSKLVFITDEKEKAEYVDDYIYFMTDYKDGLGQYRDMFKALLAQPAAERNFTEANEKRLELDHLVMRAHKKL
ncbi:hypothetical protein [Bdellovibrio sp. HCB337]|uniref:hypothetical protein n=1 Tax=Bdellovibrio sp. HCB337 TaxID=3394358 RepID=UPI0039A44948